METHSVSQFSGGRISPERLVQMENDGYWDDEQVLGRYFYPLRTKDEKGILAAGMKLAAGIPDDQLFRTGPFLCCLSPTSHIGPYRWAIDFLIPDESEVLAARDGVIIESVDNFSEWGDDPKFASRMNLITIQHEGVSETGYRIEYSQYCHLARDSTRFKIGQKVKAGEVIALTGKVGYTDRDHLHFIVFRNDPGGPVGFKSLRISEFARHRRFWLF